MKKLLFILFMIVLTSCVQYSYIMTQTQIKEYSRPQIDSVCTAEHIPPISSDKWLQTYIISFDDNKSISQQTYILRHNNIEKTFMCTQIDSIYKFNIRQLEKIKK